MPLSYKEPDYQPCPDSSRHTSPKHQHTPQPRLPARALKEALVSVPKNHGSRRGQRSAIIPPPTAKEKHPGAHSLPTPIASMFLMFMLFSMFYQAAPKPRPGTVSPSYLTNPFLPLPISSHASSFHILPSLSRSIQVVSNLSWTLHYPKSSPLGTM